MDDVNEELDRICEEKNISNQTERRILKKKLRRKMKKAKKRHKKKYQSERNGFKREVFFIDKKLLEQGGLKRDFWIKIADLGNGCWTHHHF